LRMLEQKRALKILAAMQPGAQDEMTIEECAGLAKKGEQVFAHLNYADPRLRNVWCCQT
jgi:hypothetical protein